MTAVLEEHRAALAAKLSRCAGVVAAGADRWQVGVAGNAPFELTACMRSGWLEMTSPLALGTPVALRDLLAANGRLDGGVKFCAASAPPAIRAAAQLPLDNDGDDSADLARVVAGFRQAHAVVESMAGDGDRSAFDGASACRELSPVEADDLARWCDEALWPHVRRSNGQVAVAIEARGAVHYATATIDESRRWRMSVALDGPQDATDVSHGAAAVLLLSACDAVRMARATAAGPLGAVQYGWESGWDGAGGPAVLNHALAALAMACRLTSAEVGVLADENLALRYLESRGWPDLLRESSSSVSVFS